ncbi:MAG: signal peptidase II [Bacteroidetes bacterium]|uniref:Lipoprotein signal peptidase n=1 Tax=Candidatus Cryptobacteroides avistercoris TaxID=2840758 RepID=A0A9D9NNB8_9BACT|nr:signal peptidase II [Candidatus Cryptobacteroides avistercoris]
MKLSKGTRLLVLGVLLVVIDQIIKILVKTNMSLGEQIPLIGEWCRLCFVENEGMAFGLSFGDGAGKLLLSLFRIVLSGFLIWWIHSLLRKGRAPVGVLVGLTMITAGAIGNIIDCLFYGLIWDYAPFMFGRVVDMFYFPIIRDGARVIFFSPVFNFADSCVTVGAFYLLLFHWKFFAGPEEKQPKPDSAR